MRRFCFVMLFVFAFMPREAAAACDQDGVQDSGSIYRICMPPPSSYNGMLVIWAHGFQDAGTPVSIPEDQLCLDDLCIPDIVNGLGFGFATNSYSKTGLAIVQGKADILDLVNIYTAQKGAPTKVFLVGASEGGIITALALEQHPDIFSAGLSACGPIGDFPSQIKYLGDARATFNVFFPGVIPGAPFAPPPALAENWQAYYDAVVKPIVLHPANRDRLDQWVRVAQLPYDTANYLETVAASVEDVLRYSVVNLADAARTIGGFPFDNDSRLYFGSSNDALLNLFVPRINADPVAQFVMQTQYQTTGILQRPLVTLHTLRDQQVPYWHEQLYAQKTISSGAYLRRHVNIAINRFEHCNFTAGELIGSFFTMLQLDAAVPARTTAAASTGGQQ
jgi:pimeloyl-ACP methyl ester carboxylesterase